MVSGMFGGDDALLRWGHFDSACASLGVDLGHPVVRLLRSDLVNIRPEDVWFRLLAGQPKAVPSEEWSRTDSALAILRLAESYALRASHDTRLAADLMQLPLRVIGHASPIIEEWVTSRTRIQGSGYEWDDLLNLERFVAWTPMVVGASVATREFGTTSALLEITTHFKAVDWVAQELDSLWRNDMRRLGLAHTWSRASPSPEQWAEWVLRVDSLAESLIIQWQDLAILVPTRFRDLIEEEIWATIRFAAHAVERAQGEIDAFGKAVVHPGR